VAWQESTADLLEDAVRLMQARATRCRGVVRKHTPTPAEPLVLVVVDEIAALTAYVTDTAVRKRLAAALSLLLSQGRAVGVSVVAATQDARKEVLGMRDLFPTRVALRAAEAEQADMVLGHGARSRGARTDAISPPPPASGYVALDGEPEPVRVRFAHVTDDHIAQVVRHHTADRPAATPLTAVPPARGRRGGGMTARRPDHAAAHAAPWPAGCAPPPAPTGSTSPGSPTPPTRHPATPRR
jgi:S-DNA-T family DNA segregation ATPase FtsK/SpoIIIE